MAEDPLAAAAVRTHYAADPFHALRVALNPCVYCGAPWHLESMPIEHKEDCPTMTGLYPVLEQDLPPSGEGMCCTACGDPFELGDMSCRQNLEGNWADVVIVVCMSCALHARTN